MMLSLGLELVQVFSSNAKFPRRYDLVKGVRVGFEGRRPNQAADEGQNIEYSI